MPDKGIRPSCRVCGSEISQPVGAIVAGFVISAGGKQFEHAGYGIRRCEHCHVYFKTAHPGPMELERYYELLEFESFESNQLFPTDRLVLSRLTELPPASRVLDFGCGVGRLLGEVAGRHKCAGVEVNVRAAEVARSRGIEILSSDQLLAQPRQDFDAIVVTDVYEHLVQPVALLRRLFACVKPGGRLILVTGNADAVPHQDLIGEFWYFRSFGHLHMLGHAHLHWLGEQLTAKLCEAVNVCHYDVSIRERVFQHVRYWAYCQFRMRPTGIVSGLLKCIPVLRRAQNWPWTPALMCTKDHVVATFLKP